jgi:hypothetical protein
MRRVSRLTDLRRWLARLAVAQTNDREQEKAILNFSREFVARICCSEKLKLFIATADISANKTLSEAVNDGVEPINEYPNQ